MRAAILLLLLVASREVRGSGSGSGGGLGLGGLLEGDLVGTLDDELEHLLLVLVEDFGEVVVEGGLLLLESWVGEKRQF